MQLKGYSLRKFLHEFPQRNWTHRGLDWQKEVWAVGDCALQGQLMTLLQLKNWCKAKMTSHRRTVPFVKQQGRLASIISAYIELSERILRLPVMSVAIQRINLSLQISQGSASMYFSWSGYFMQFCCVYSRTGLPTFIEIGSYLTDTEQKKSWHVFYWDTV